MLGFRLTAKQRWQQQQRCYTIAAARCNSSYNSNGSSCYNSSSIITAMLDTFAQPRAQQYSLRSSAARAT
jgi:hypothetical protein